MSSSELITLDLNEFDADGIVVDGSTAQMTREQISDIVDHAAQAILVRRAGGNVDAILDELEEALETYGVIAERDGTKPTP